MLRTNIELDAELMNYPAASHGVVHCITYFL